MTKHYYRYFVSYYYYWRPKTRIMSYINNQPFQPDFGSAVINVEKPIDESVKFIEKHIVNHITNNFEIRDEKIIIISYQLMKEYDEESED